MRADLCLRNVQGAAKQVCGANGLTYQSKCLAECYGVEPLWEVRSAPIQAQWPLVLFNLYVRSCFGHITSAAPTIVPTEALRPTTIRAISM